MRTGLAIAMGFATALFAPAALAQDSDNTVEPPKVQTTVKTTTTEATSVMARRGICAPFPVGAALGV